MNRRGFFKRTISAIAAIAGGTAAAKVVEPVMKVIPLKTHTIPVGVNVTDFQQITGHIFFADLKKYYAMSFEKEANQ